MATRLSRPVFTRSTAPSRSQRHTLATAHTTRRRASAWLCLEGVVCSGSGRRLAVQRTFVHVAEADESICSSHKHRDAMRSDCPRLSPTDAWQISLKRGIGPASSLICSRHVATISFATSSTSSLLYVHANLLQHASKAPSQPRRHVPFRACDGGWLWVAGRSPLAITLVRVGHLVLQHRRDDLLGG